MTRRLAPRVGARHFFFAFDKPVAVERGMRFAMREGGRTIGAGVIAGVLD